MVSLRGSASSIILTSPGICLFPARQLVMRDEKWKVPSSLHHLAPRTSHLPSSSFVPSCPRHGKMTTFQPAEKHPATKKTPSVRAAPGMPLHWGMMQMGLHLTKTRTRGQCPSKCRLQSSSPTALVYDYCSGQSDAHVTKMTIPNGLVSFPGKAQAFTCRPQSSVGPVLFRPPSVFRPSASATRQSGRVVDPNPTSVSPKSC